MPQVCLKKITCFFNLIRMSLNKLLRKDIFICSVPLGMTQPYVFKGWILFISENERTTPSVQHVFLRTNTLLLLLHNCYNRQHIHLSIIITYMNWRCDASYVAKSNFCK